MKESDVAKKLLWVDLEMTGLDPGEQRIIEIAVLVTDFEFNELGSYQAVINQPESVLEAAEEWPKQNMQQLFDEVRQSAKNEEQVRAELCEFISEYFDQPATLAGNSIHQDRRFIRRWWPDVEALLHYRMLDVSSYKIWVQSHLGAEYEKQETHRAMDDITESIEELKWAIATIRNSA